MPDMDDKSIGIGRLVKSPAHALGGRAGRRAVLLRLPDPDLIDYRLGTATGDGKSGGICNR